jgi:hypothetical protein
VVTPLSVRPRTQGRRLAVAAGLSFSAPALTVWLMLAIDRLLDPLRVLDVADLAAVLLAGVVWGLLAGPVVLVPAVLGALTLATLEVRDRIAHVLLGAALGPALSVAAGVITLWTVPVVALRASALAGGICGSVYWRIAVMDGMSDREATGEDGR